jgi:hypothetical protein
MTDSDNDGWPDEYRDPRNRPHPEVLRVTVETGGELRDEVAETARAAASGDSPPAVVSFATVPELRKILTGRRIELLQALTDLDGAAESITALAEALDRDYRSSTRTSRCSPTTASRSSSKRGSRSDRTFPTNGSISTSNSSGSTTVKSPHRHDRRRWIDCPTHR